MAELGAVMDLSPLHETAAAATSEEMAKPEVATPEEVLRADLCSTLTPDDRTRWEAHVDGLLAKKKATDPFLGSY